MSDLSKIMYLMDIVAVVSMLVGAMIMHLLHAYRQRMQAKKAREMSRINYVRAQGIVASGKMCVVEPPLFREFKNNWDSLTTIEKESAIKTLLDSKVKNESIIEATISKLVKDTSI